MLAKFLSLSGAVFSLFWKSDVPLSIAEKRHITCSFCTYKQTTETGRILRGVRLPALVCSGFENESENARCGLSAGTLVEMQIATRQADGNVAVETPTPRIAKMGWECEGTSGVRLTLTDNTEVLIHDEEEITQAMADCLACAPYSTQPAAESNKAAQRENK